jgi:chromosome segregation ATPase
VPTYEDRLTNVEHRLASLELQRLHKQSRETGSNPRLLDQRFQRVNEDMTILLGLIVRQGESLQVVKDDVNVIKERVERIETRLDGMEQRMEQSFSSIDQHFSSQDEKFERITNILATLTAKVDKLGNDS